MKTALFSLKSTEIPCIRVFLLEFTQFSLSLQKNEKFLRTTHCKNRGFYEETPAKTLSVAEFQRFLARQQHFSAKKAEKLRFLSIFFEFLKKFFLFRRSLAETEEIPAKKPGFLRTPSVFVTLYSLKDQHLSRIDAVLRQELEAMRRNLVKPLAISQKIVEIKRRQALEKLFELMDSDCDGCINSENLDISAINSQKLLVLAPFFCEMERIRCQFTRENFIETAEKFAKTLCLRDIRVLFD